MFHSILITVAVLTGINGLLALFLVVAERYFANYGECQIRINDNDVKTVEGGATLLNSLKLEKIYLPSACGGRGTCAYCKCKVQDGGGTILPTEEALLTPDEIKDKFRLACQLKVKRDVSISIPEELFNIKEFRAEVTKLEDLTYDIKLLRVRLIEPEEIHFVSGQYVQLQNKPYEKVKSIASRAYSIASSNSNTGEIDLMVRLIPDGIVTTWVHQHLEVGEEIVFTGPMGDFRLHDGESEIVMVAGGSGMAPMVSILDELHRAQSTRPVTYFFGAVTKKDLYFVKEMKAYEDKLANFKFVPALSAPAAEDNWDGVTGLITVPLQDHLQSSNSDQVQGYLCGSPGMVNACIQLFIKNGIEENSVFFDPFS